MRRTSGASLPYAARPISIARVRDYVTPEGSLASGSGLCHYYQSNLMSLITAHRILIVAAIVMFIVYGLAELRGYSSSGEGFALFRAGLSFLAVIGWALYLRTVGKKP